MTTRLLKCILLFSGFLGVVPAWATGPTVVQVTARNVLSFSTLPAAHDAVIVAVAGDYTTDPTVSDNQGNTYTKIVTAGWESGVHDTVTLYWCPSIGTPSGTFTVSLTGTGASSYALMEVSGASAVDVATASPYNATAVNSYTMTGGAPTAQANELVIAALVSGYSASSLGFADPSSGYTRWWLADLDSGNHASSMAYKTTSSIETSAAAWSWTTADQIGAAIVTFRGAANSFSVVGQAEGSSATAQTSLATSTPLNVQAGDRFCAVVASTSSTQPSNLVDTAGDLLAFVGALTPQSGYYLYAYETIDARANSADTFTANGTGIFGVAVLQVRGLANSMLFPAAPSFPVSGNGGYSAKPQASPGTGTDAITSGAFTPEIQPAAVIGFSAIPGESGLAVNAAPNAGTGFTAQTGVWGTWGGGAGDYLGVFETKQVTSTAVVAATFTAPTYGTGNYGTFEWVIPMLQ